MLALPFVSTSTPGVWKYGIVVMTAGTSVPFHPEDIAITEQGVGRLMHCLETAVNPGESEDPCLMVKGHSICLHLYGNSVCI